MGWFGHGASRIYYEESGSGDPVLLLPGFSDTIAGHSLLRETLRPRFRVIAADLPGSGRSLPQPRQYTASFYQDDARSFIALLQHLGAAPAHLVGYSDGGEDALLMASTNPDVVRSVLTWGAAGVISDPSGKIRETFGSVVDSPIPSLEEYREYLVATYGRANARTMTQNFVKAITAIIETGGDISRSRAGAITCPVLLMAGEDDMFVPKALLDELATHISTAETIEAKDAGHDVHKARPEWFAQIVLNWVTRHQEEASR